MNGVLIYVYPIEVPLILNTILLYVPMLTYVAEKGQVHPPNQENTGS